jgi:osmotically-inducible protein OsmY
MDLNLAAVVFMGGFVLAIVAAALLLAFRPEGGTVTISAAGRPAPDAAGRRDEILLGGETDALGTPSGRVQAVLVQPATLEIQALAVSRGAGLLEDQLVPADAILAADGQTVYLAETWTPAPPEEAAGAVPLRLGAAVLGADRKRLGKLQVVCFDRESKVVTALAVAGRRDGNSLRLVPVERLQGAGPNRIVTAVPAAEWATLLPYASDRAISQAVLDQLAADPVLKPFLPSLAVDVRDQQVRLRGYVSERAQAERAAALAAAVPGVLQVEQQIVSDDDLARAVSQAIGQDPATAAALVQVRSRFGRVEVGGSAPDARTVRAIEALAIRVPGVQAVHNLTMVRTGSPS